MASEVNLKFAFANAAHSLCLTNEWFPNAVKLLPFIIKRNNATVGGGGAPFSKAYCDREMCDVEFLFGDIFQQGISLVTKYLAQETFPVDRTESLLLGKLFTFKAEEKCINADPQRLKESEFAVLLANHLFGRLAMSNRYIVNKSIPGKKDDQCFCNASSCKMTGQYGDTSVGNREVWHGNVDVIIKSDLIVQPLENLPCSPEGTAPFEEKVKSYALSGNAQIISQTIVFSFLQKQMHPEREHFLTPCIAVGNSSMIVMFYDSEHDVILESSSIPLFRTSGENGFEFDDCAILVSWLAVNYKFLSSGLTEEMKKCKSHFFTEAQEKLKIYEQKLQLGNISSLPVHSFQKRSLHWSSFIEETENELIGIIHREKKRLKVFESEEGGQCDRN
ncbi:uncharacterized protein LOC133195727 [Saccostrea echinata]|uniref:uncharacterized protein LOC133195727 n=1 Tax=Saccostrea echinata TaxID=191078 RepID=UPI002A8056DD|nr:uncharacterized protein LOC133195727 [Saccostrea echinata]